MPFEKRLSALANIDSNASVPSIAGGHKGVEKESLRIDASGYLSHKPHPKSLGSALASAFITTDFSEALLEFVTPPFANTWEALRAVCDIHQFTYEHLEDELIWVASMPCRIPDDRNIPLARYGGSNVGQMKTIYRRGLGHRYGRHMQTIAGVHFNYSLPTTFWPIYQQILGNGGDEATFRSEQYMGLIRNFRRYGWILLYLFGASPALCKTFMGDDDIQLPSFNDETWYEPFGTSLRMSDLGYNNQSQSRINISLNSVDDYIRDLSAAIRTPEPAYEKIGVKVDGKYRQLNANLLQIENEYYSSIRPKRVAKSGERPTAALRRGGIEYVEVRSLDINIFDPCGINQNTMRFIEAFLVYCLLETSPPIGDKALDEAATNQLQTAKFGRDPVLLLYRDGEAIDLADWAREILSCVAAVAEVIDKGEGSDTYTTAVQVMMSLVDDAEATPSARVLSELRAADCGFFDFALSVAHGHRDYFKSIAPLDAGHKQELEREARESIERQRDIEESDVISLDEYLERYFAAD
ncbi:MAG: glutamate--cysteine ligase [Gammaproteobacteria bacterium]|nr:glutamate--cysteine ligase [Gammaproteobacteria bacterium]